MFKLSFALAAAAVTFIPLAAVAALSAQPGAHVSFTASGPAGMTIVGTTSEFAAADDGQTITLTVPLAHLVTGIDLRDKHMREKYLEVQTYPNAVFAIPRASVAFPAAGAGSEGDVQGSMTIHGRSHPATFHYRASNDGTAYHVDASSRLNMNDYGIVVPSYMGITVKPEVSLRVQFVASDR